MEAEGSRQEEAAGDRCWGKGSGPGAQATEGRGQRKQERGQSKVRQGLLGHVKIFSLKAIKRH